jgi:2-oxoglutarate dehydrogenase E1 component
VENPPAPEAPAPPQARPAATSPAPAAGPPADPAAEPLRGAAARIVENMQRSLSVPTATSIREIPVGLLDANRRVLNAALAGRMKLSFTHIIAWAALRALRTYPNLKSSYVEISGEPHRHVPEHVNFGIAVDVERKDGARSLLVPNIKSADLLGFDEFVLAYDDVVERARTNRLDPSAFAGTTWTLTNPGTLGTTGSIPRLMAGQGLILATGAIGFPASLRSLDERAISSLGLGKAMTITSTYDHRVIQGAESGLFLQRIEQLLQGEDRFYEEIFTSLQILQAPVRELPRPTGASVDRAIAAAPAEIPESVQKQWGVLQLIHAYRVRGHLIAQVNPLSQEVEDVPDLDPAEYGLTQDDMDRDFYTGGLAGTARATLREILILLEGAYCGTLSVEYMHIQDRAQKDWIRERVEGAPRPTWIDLAGKRRILDRLNAAEAFEKFLHIKYVGHKRFSLEGLEVLIPTLDTLFTRAAEAGVLEAVLGMAHRGRLDVLTSILGMKYETIFRVFDGEMDPFSLEGSGDVKYHLGAQGKHVLPDGRSIFLTLASNPSHLEAVDPVVEGMVRAKQDRLDESQRFAVLPVLIHGDAAFAGQGVVAETLNLSMLKGYRTGGTVHIVTNNGIGFTTAPVDARSSTYCTDVARMVQAPIFHANANDPEACHRVTELAFGFRQEFRKDVVVDFVGYRRYGHNEGDEPSYTQPIMYRKIQEMPSVRELYTETLVQRGDIDSREAEAAMEDFRAKMDAAFEATRESRPPSPNLVKPPSKDEAVPSIPTGVARETLEEILSVVSRGDGGLHVHPKLHKQLEARARMLKEDAVDWAAAEALAFGSLLLEGIPIRLSGQDSRRGTFSQRHSVLIDYENGSELMPLNHLREGQAPFMAYDSLLSEFAVLGFEFGYSTIAQDALVLWEAQFGDFANGAQVIIDQFVASAEEKWAQKSRLVMLLPHGFEGQGPEHSSARLERFLTLSANSNMKVVMPTTAAQYFHLLRRQMHQGPAKPLIVMSPKSLLRAPLAKSPASDFVDGAFRHVLDDITPDREATRIVLASGKIAFDAMNMRKAKKIGGVAILRLEQLYPFPGNELAVAFSLYPKATEIRWLQEEPLNMGAWSLVASLLPARLPKGARLTCTGRTPNGSPATGSMTVHTAEQEHLVLQALQS